MNLLDLLPKHKSDFSTIKDLKKLSDQDFKQIGMGVLEWFQDINWPIARDIKDLVVLKQDVMLDHILIVLNGSDEWWKYWIITNILPELTVQNIKVLLPKLIDIYDHPTASEIDVGVYDEVVNFMHDKQYKNNCKEVSNLVINSWNEGRLPDIDGLLLKNGKIYKNIRFLENKCNKELIYTYLTDINKCDDSFTYIDIFDEKQYKNYKIFSGDCSHGSYGYVLVLSQKDEFEWLLLDQINPIEILRIEDNAVYALNNNNEIFILPIDRPEFYQIRSSDN